MKHISHILFLVFLVIYSVLKYQAVPELMGQATYMQTTAIMVILTAVLPYGIGFFLTRKTSGNTQILLAFVTPLILCIVGLATYFYIYIAPNAPGLAVTKVLPRAILPGLIMGAILAVPIYLKRKQ
jgi:lipoprotein signal peptidase